MDGSIKLYKIHKLPPSTIIERTVDFERMRTEITPELARFKIKRDTCVLMA